MSSHPLNRRVQTLWHRFLAKVFELTVGRLGVQVDTEVQISSDPPKIDVVLLRRESSHWTQEQAAVLPDGVRDTTAHSVLLEFKYSESLTLDALLQSLGYEYFYRTSHDLTQADVQMFVLSAKTPKRERLTEWGFTAEMVPGVWQSSNVYAKHITLLVLNDLRDLPHNAFVKAFASRKQQKAKAFAHLQNFQALSFELLHLLNGLQAIWSLPEGASMNEELTVEKVMAIGTEYSHILLRNLPIEEIDDYINPVYKQYLLEQGLEQGLERGSSQRTREIVLAMATRQIDIATIADVTGLTIAEVQALLEDANQYKTT